MDKVTLTVFFDGMFWAGVFERVEGGRLSACKVIFGPEPKDSELLEFIQRSYGSLKFSPQVDAPPERIARNPKRCRREAGRQAKASGIGTKSHQALQLQRELSKAEGKARKREKAQSDEERKYLLKQEKRKRKHRAK